jgi:hypothetical protein
MGKASRRKQLNRYAKQPTDRVKISDAIWEICQPFFPPDRNLKKHELEKLVVLAIIAWNITNLPADKQAEELMKVIEKIPNMKEELETDIIKMEKLGEFLPEEELSIGSMTLQILSEMIKRKKELYPNENSMIEDFTVKESPNGYGLHVSAFLSTNPNSISA